jgi:hypothetical protein
MQLVGAVSPATSCVRNEENRHFWWKCVGTPNGYAGYALACPCGVPMKNPAVVSGGVCLTLRPGVHPRVPKEPGAVCCEGNGT